MLRIALLAIVVPMLIGSFPLWLHGAGWGYYAVSGTRLFLVAMVPFIFRSSSRV